MHDYGTEFWPRHIPDCMRRVHRDWWRTSAILGAHMKILITGAAGFIGSHLRAELVNGGHDVIGVDREDGDLRQHPRRQASDPVATSPTSSSTSPRRSAVCSVRTT